MQTTKRILKEFTTNKLTGENGILKKYLNNPKAGKKGEKKISNIDQMSQRENVE